MGNWHIMEIRAYIEAWAKKTSRMIPVILPGVEGTPRMPVWVRQNLWVDLRDWKKKGDDGFYRLVCGIVNRPPGSDPRSNLNFTAGEVAGWADTN